MPPVWIVLLLLPIFGEAARFECRGRILGAYYADAKSGCKAFHVCVRVAGGGIRDFRFFCPPGTLFHQEAQTCTDWGDDDPLACPALIYDGQFDLYKIGSGYDTKKLSSPGNRDEEAEFGLQRAETGDRRSQNSNNGPASDLRAAHSSDFFSGQRDRGRDEPAGPSPASSAHPNPPPRQSFRRPTTRVTPSSTLNTPLPNSTPGQYETKRKLVRKRPIYVSTAAPTTYATSLPPSQQPQQNFNQAPQLRQNQINFNQPPKQNFNQQAQQTYNQQPQPKQSQQIFNQQVQQNYNQQPQPKPTQQNFNQSPQKSVQVQKSYNQQQPSSQPQQNYKQEQQNFNQRPAPKPTTIAPANVPQQYKDEYVEVPRVTPKQTPNRYYPNRDPNSPTAATFPSSTPAPKLNKKEGLAELYNYDAQSTPGFNVQQSSSQPFKVKNSFVVSDIPEDFARTSYNSNRGKPTTIDYNTAATRAFVSSTASYKNINSVAYEPEKNNFVSFSGTKQNYYNTPTTAFPTTTYYTTTRADSSLNLNTIAYNTNNALNNIQPANYVDGGEDDGQYRPPPGEDDGQYRPELYERELLSGAHSLNIAASGNRLPEERKTNGKIQLKGQTSAPRPFRPAPTPPTPTTTRAPATTYTTTYKPPTSNTQRTFDYFQTYTTTSRPNDTAVPTFNYSPVSSVSPVRPTAAPRAPETRPSPRAPEPRPTPREPAPPTSAPARPPSNPPNFAKPANKQEDTSYDYAYYDSDSGFTEYDHIEEFGKTKTRT